MYDYTIKIKKDNKIICAVGGHLISYDNILWWQLDKLVKIATSPFKTKRELLKRIESETEYFREAKTFYKKDPVLDLDNMTIDMPYFPLYKPEEVCPEDCCISLKIKDGKYYAVYEETDEYPMEYVEFDDVALLKKKRATLNEFQKVCDFVNTIIKSDETDFVLNNELIIRFNNA